MKNLLKLRTGIVCLLLLFISQTPAVGQITEGSMSGTVTDVNGAVMPGTTITVKNLQTGETRQVVTDATGLYRVPLLRPGAYEVRAERENFKTAVVPSVEVVVNTIVRADLQLEPGSVQEMVTVTAEATSLVNTEEARLAHTLTTRQVQELPLNGRDINQLALLQPGVTATLAPVISNTQFNRFNYSFSANGSSPRGNNYVLDGVSNNNEWLGGTPAISPSVEMIQEFQVQTVNFSAEYGRNNGSVVIAISRAGSNEFHGSLYNFFRNDALDARNFFDPPGAKSILKQNQFGGSLGGPIRRDRTFFFGNYEGLRAREGRTVTVVGETPEFRNYVATVRPNSIANNLFRQYPAPPCIPGTAVDAGSVFRPDLTTEQLRQIAFSEFATGPLDGIPDRCRVGYVDRRPIRGDQYSIRIDHQFNAADRIFIRYLGDKRKTDSGREQLGGAVTRGFKAPFHGDFPSVLAGYTRLFSPTVVNDFRFGFIRSDFGIGFQAPNSGSDNFPTIVMDDGAVRFGGGIFVPREFTFNNFIFSDTLTVTRGNHNVKFGAEVRRIYENSDYQLETLGFYEFNNIFAFANDTPYYYEALVNPTTGIFTGTPRRFRWTQLGAFIQDDWKVTRKLTLNLGLRYDLYGVPTEANGILSNIILGQGATMDERVENGRIGRVDKMAETDRNNFAPRVGFAYDVFGNGSTSLRGSFAMAYLEPYSNLITNVTRFLSPDSAWAILFPLRNSALSIQDITYGVPAVQSPKFQGLSPTGGIPGIRIGPAGLQSDLRTAYSQQWFLGVQRNLGGPLYLSANYVSTSGKKLYIRNDINRFTGDLLDGTLNRFNPEWAQTFFVMNGNESTYHGMNVQLQKRYSSGYQFSFNYTYGKSIDIVSDPGLGDMVNVSVGGYTGTQDVNNPRLDRATSDFDVRHRVTLYGIWDLPSPDGPKLVNGILGGWQLNMIGTFQTGRPFSVICTNTITCDWNRDGVGYDRPNTPAFGNSLPRDSKNDYLNGLFTVADFPIPAAGANGSLARNSFRGPNYSTVDVSIFKNFRITENSRLQFRAEAFNVFNRTNLWLPNNNMSNTLLFGRSTASFDPRQIQFALRFLF